MSHDLLIFVEQSAEAVAPSEGVSRSSSAGGVVDGERPGQASGVADGCVAVRVLAEPRGGMPLVDDQRAVEGSRWMLPTRRSAIALARGVRTGVLSVCSAYSLTRAR